jgi:hypothetical protein
MFSNSPIAALLVFFFPQQDLVTRIEEIGLRFNETWWRETIVTQLSDFHDNQMQPGGMKKYSFEYVLHLWYTLKQIISGWDGVLARQDDDGSEHGGEEDKEGGEKDEEDVDLNKDVDEDEGDGRGGAGEDTPEDDLEDIPSEEDAPSQASKKSSDPSSRQPMH